MLNLQIVVFRDAATNPSNNFAVLAAAGKLAQYSKACLDATVPFRSPVQIALFLPFQNEEEAIFIV